MLLEHTCIAAVTAQEVNYILIVILVSFGINSRHLDNPTAKLAIRASLGGTAMATLLFGLVKKIITL